MKHGFLMTIAVSIIVTFGLSVETATAGDQTATVTWENGHLKAGDFGYLGPGDSLTVTNAAGIDIWVRYNDETVWTLVPAGSSLVLSNVGTSLIDCYYARSSPPKGDGEEVEGCEVISIPAVSEWGLVCMTLLLLTAGTIVFARRRRAPA